MSTEAEIHSHTEKVPSNELQVIEESEMENTVDEIKLPITQMKHLNTRESIGSIDSDVSLSFDVGSGEKEVDSDKSNQKSDHYTTDSGNEEYGSNEKDSGCEVSKEDSKLSKCDKSEEEESPFEPPDEELVNKIVAQVEYYFSDENITKDAFLLKHVKRNKEGYVSLKLISSFKRVKHLAKDWRAVAYALQRSIKLEVNETQTKLRRKDPLPVFDQTTPSRTIIAINLPMEKPTIENVAEIFREFGEIALIRILRPGSSIPSDVRSFANKHPEMTGVMSALIEFERTESAKAATDRPASSWRTDLQAMQVIELNAPVSDKKKRGSLKKTIVNKLLESELSSSCPSGSDGELDIKYLQRRSSSPHPTRGSEIPRLQRRFSANRDIGPNYVCHDSYRERPCNYCSHCERRYSSSGSGYDSPVPSGYRRYSLSKEGQETGYQIPALRRFSGMDSCCLLRRCSRDSSESSGSYPRSHELPRRFSRDSLSSTESGLQRRYSRDSVSSENNYRRYSRDSISSEVFAPAFLSRNNSRDIMDLPRRSSFGAGVCGHHPLMHSGSRGSFSSSNCAPGCSPLVPENVVRMPKGPDGSKGFVTAP